MIEEREFTSTLQDLLHDIDEWLEQGCKSGAFASLGGTAWNSTAAQEAELLRNRLAEYLNPIIGEEPVGPRIECDLHSDDRVFETKFDGRLWFMQASDEEILAVARTGWRNSYDTDNVAQFMADHDKQVADVFKYLEAISDRPSKKDECGFACNVSQEQALAWLRAQKPELAKKVQLICDGEEE